MLKQENYYYYLKSLYTYQNDHTYISEIDRRTDGEKKKNDVRKNERIIDMENSFTFLLNI